MDAEQEELEALKKWWHENGRSVIVGLVLGLGGVFGYTTWQAHTEASAEQASIVYQSMSDMALAGDHAEAVLRADQIIENYPGSEYAALSGLLGAKSALAAGSAVEANRLLDWVIANAGREELRDIARIRSARLMVDGGKRDEALAMLATVKSPEFAAETEELKGDILAHNGDRADAIKAYELALADASITSGTRARVQMKLDDLGQAR